MALQVLQVQNLPPIILNLLTSLGNAQPVTVAQAPGLPQSPAPLQGNIFIDPANSTGNASDTNPGTSTAPLKTWAGLIAIWGTFSPLITLTTTITFQSSHVDNSDPVIFAPYIKGGVQVAIQGSTINTATGVAISALTAKNRTAGANSQLLYSVAGQAGPQTLQMVQNTTHPGNAWLYVFTGVNAFKSTQPMAAQSLGLFAAPAEVDTWAAADTVNVVNFTSVNLVYLRPISLDQQGPNFFQLFHLVGFDPGGVSTNPSLFDFTACRTVEAECVFQRQLISFSSTLYGSTWNNCLFRGTAALIGQHVINGGAAVGGGGFNIQGLNNSQVQLDGDFVMQASALMSGGVSMGFVFLDGSCTLIERQLTLTSTNYGGHVLYGSAGSVISLIGSSRLSLQGGTYTAGITQAGMVAGINMNGGATAVSHTNAQPDVLNGNINTTVANLDAAAGATGFGGVALKFGGCSIANVA